MFFEQIVFIEVLAFKLHTSDKSANMFFSLLVLFVIACVVRFSVNEWPFIKLAVTLPGPPAYPIVGNALKFACKSEELLDRVVSIVMPFNDVTPIRLWMGPILHVVITQPRDIEVILNSQLACNKGYAYTFLRPFIGEGLISGSGKSWKLHRKIITHTVKQRTLDEFIGIFDKHSKHFTKKLEPLAERKTFNVLKYVESCTIDIVCETVMGNSKVDALNNPDLEFMYCTKEMYKVVHKRMMKVWLYPDWLFRLTSNYSKQQHAQKIIRNFTEQCIESRLKEMREGKKGISFLESLLALNNTTNELSPAELRDEIYTVYIASQDTLAVTGSFAILMLGIHKDVQNKARTEVDEILKGGAITPETLSKLRYLEMLIKETLRLFPIAPLMVRQLQGEIKLENHILPRGCQVVIVPYATHRSAKFWKSPNKFNPERFTFEESLKRHSYAFIPFSGGPMGCLGKKYAIRCLKIVLANILKKFIIKSNVNLNDMKLKTDISIRSANGYDISLQLRSNE